MPDEPSEGTPAPRNPTPSGEVDPAYAEDYKHMVNSDSPPFGHIPVDLPPESPPAVDAGDGSCGGFPPSKPKDEHEDADS